MCILMLRKVRVWPVVIQLNKEQSPDSSPSCLIPEPKPRSVLYTPSCWQWASQCPL